jgi:hypothetical protein
MARIFSFERELHATLDLMPLTVRRKLDLAGLKLSLAGWQALPIADRRALAGVEVDDDASVASFTATLRAATARVGAPLEPLSPRGLPAWRTPTLPPGLCARLLELAVSLDDPAWARLDDEARYALLKLSDKHPDRLRIALVELGLAPV